MRDSLFRSQAVDNASCRRYGAILLTQSFNSTIFTAIVVFFCLGICVFFALFGYARKAQVSGILLPSQGLIRIMPVQPGVVTERRAHDGQAVKSGDILFVLTNERSSAKLGNAEKAISSLIQFRRDSIRNEQAQLRLQANERIDASQQRADYLSVEIRRIEEQISLQQRRVVLAENNVKRFSKLAAEEFVSPVQVQDKQADLLDQQQRLSDLMRAQAASARELMQAQATVRDLRIQWKRDQEAAKRNASAIEQDLSENEARREILVRAPHDGTVTAITADVGQSVSAMQMLAAILPANSQLEAELYVPSRSVGFLEPGMQVSLRYPAYPYQKFGQAAGTVRDISITALRPDELMLAGAAVPTSANSEPLYRVRVALGKQTVKAFGQDQRLRSGTAVDASIVLEKRKLYEWMLEPLYTITGRA